MKLFGLCFNWFCGRILLSFLFLPLAVLAEPADEEIRSTVLALLSEGETLADQGKFAGAVSTLNRALGLVEQAAKPNQPLRERVERALRITKGRAIVARYKEKVSGPGENLGGNAPVLLKSEEPKDVEVHQVFGSVLLRGKWEARRLEKAEQSFGFGRRVMVASQSGVELQLPGKANLTLRAVDACSFSLPSKDVLLIHSGAYALRADEDDAKLRLEAPFAELELASDDPFAVMFGVTTNGGLKLIGLVGEAQLRRPGEKTLELRPGQLVFVLPKGYSRKMYVELSTLITTADLLTAFEEPPTYYKRLRTEALAQALRTRRRYRTVVGDVKGTESFEVKVLREDEKKKNR